MSLRERNLLREQMLEIADRIRHGDLSQDGAATALESLAKSDIEAIEEEDITFDLGALLEATPAEKAPPSDPDPVTRALLHAIQLHDRNAALRIAGDQVSQVDLDALNAALRDLHAALSTRFGS